MAPSLVTQFLKERLSKRIQIVSGWIVLSAAGSLLAFSDLGSFPSFYLSQFPTKWILCMRAEIGTPGSFPTYCKTNNH